MALALRLTHVRPLGFGRRASWRVQPPFLAALLASPCFEQNRRSRSASQALFIESMLRLVFPYVAVLLVTSATHIDEFGIISWRVTSATHREECGIISWRISPDFRARGQQLLRILTAVFHWLVSITHPILSSVSCSSICCSLLPTY